MRTMMDSSNIQQAWLDICEQIKKYEGVDSTQINAFFSRLVPQAISDGFLMITADNEFIKTWIERHYLEFIRQALQDLYHMPFTVLIEIDESAAKNAPIPVNPVPVQPISTSENVVYVPVQQHQEQFHSNYPAQNVLTKEENYIDVYKEPKPLSDQTNNPTSMLTFENFVIGDSNRMAYSMAVSVAEMPGKAHLNPLFIYGKSGLGKTHLMRAIQNYIHETQLNLRTVYVDSAELLSDYMDASAAHDKEKTSFRNFKTHYEEADVLLIDDVQYLQGKKQTLDIVFQILNKITDMGKQVVLSADRAPKNIDIDERYKSRFNSGATFDIQPPEIETKLGIVKSCIQDYKENEKKPDFNIPENVQIYIAEISSSNIRELKSAVTKVIYQMVYFNQSTITLDEVKSLLENHFSGGSTKRLTIADIQKVVEEFYKVSHADLVGKKRTRNIIYARQIAIWLCRQLLDLPYNDIGKKFNRDHSTAMYSVSEVEKAIKESRELREEIELLQQKIKED